MSFVFFWSDWRSHFWTAIELLSLSNPSVWLEDTSFFTMGLESSTFSLNSLICALMLFPLVLRVFLLLNLFNLFLKFLSYFHQFLFWLFNLIYINFYLWLEMSIFFCPLYFAWKLFAWQNGLGPSWTKQYTQCSYHQLCVLYCTATWRQPGLSIVNQSQS